MPPVDSCDDSEPRQHRRCEPFASTVVMVEVMFLNLVLDDDFNVESEDEIRLIESFRLLNAILSFDWCLHAVSIWPETSILWSEQVNRFGSDQVAKRFKESSG